MEDPDSNYGGLSLVVIKATRACDLRRGYCYCINEDTEQYGTSISEGPKGQEVGVLCVVDPEANGEETINHFRELGIPFRLSAFGAWLLGPRALRAVDLTRGRGRAVRSVYWFDVNETVASAYKLTYTTSPYTARSLLTSVQKYGRDALLDGKWNRERPFAEG